MSNTTIDSDLQEKLSKYGLSFEEYELMKLQLGKDSGKGSGKEPNQVEWAVYSALWSEHCSYKSSKVHLKKFACQKDEKTDLFDEGAGVVDLGQGEKITFKMESHNHPSFIEPFQGAATGVGGILRDIFSMGARPIGLANYLCFGDPKADRMSDLVDGVVRGLTHYGNCVGVPTLQGQTHFHEKYNGNILVNAFALGLIAKPEKLMTSIPQKSGLDILYAGAKTGRDGVHGASMASQSFDDDGPAQKTTVQIGDPYYEKCLIEACLEVMNAGLIHAVQDMGAAGVTSSSFEMAAKSGFGLDIHLDKVPLRDQTMGPEEILLSESQERMLFMVEPENVKAIQKIFAKWDLDAEVLGTVTDHQKVRLFFKNELLSEIDPHKLTEEAPAYNRPFDAFETKAFDKSSEFGSTKKLDEVYSQLPAVSRKWIYDQFDQRVGASTEKDCRFSIGVQRLPSGRSVGIALGCDPSLTDACPVWGSRLTYLVPSFSLAIKGFKTLALTDCLNFGNPQKTKVMGQFASSVDQLASLSHGFGTPVISGNVSLYNETDNENVPPTPAVGLVGLKSDQTHSIPEDCFQKSGDQVYLMSLDLCRYDYELKTGQAQVTKLTDGSVTYDIKALKLFSQFCLENSIHWSSSQVVEKLGLEYALSQSARKSRLSLKWSEEFKDQNVENKTKLKLGFMQILVSVKQQNLKSFTDAFEQFKKDHLEDESLKHLSLIQLGEVHESDEYVSLTGESYNATELTKKHETSWRKHFERLE